MGFFDWLTGAKAKVQTDDRIWLTKQAKFAGIQRDIAAGSCRSEWSRCGFRRGPLPGLPR